MPHSNSGPDAPAHDVHAHPESTAASPTAASPTSEGSTAGSPTPESAAPESAAPEWRTPGSAASGVGAEQRGEPAADTTPAGEQSGPVFGVKAARGQAPYAILGRTSRLPLAPPPEANRSAARGEGQVDESQAEETSRSTHALRVAGGQVVQADSGSDETREGNGGKGVHEVRLPPIDDSLPLEARPAEAMRLAQEAFSQTGYWVSFYRAILGVEGAVFKLFPTAEEMAFFEETPEFGEIHTMLTALRASDVEKIDAVEPQTMITIRMPRSLRAVLVEEAKPLKVSINKLCISKLLLPINPRFVPPERGRVRGRKPGEQTRSNRAKKGAKAKREE